MATTNSNSPKIFNYNNVQVQVTDNRGTWVEGKPVQQLVGTFDPSGNLLNIVVPEPKRRDTTKNPALYTGPLTGMEVTVHKDGTYGFSWTPKVGEMKLLTVTKVVAEFRKAMEAYYEAIK